MVAPRIPDRTPFVGRRREYAALAAELDRGTRLLTITGPSGMGKTRLSRQVLGGDAAARHREAGGAWFCRAGGCRTAADLQAEVANLLGITQKDGPLLARAIAQRGSTLLVLDNLDDVARVAGPILEGWIDACPDLQVIVTSIVPIAIEGEVRFGLGPLDEEDAVQLYLEAARRASADRAFTGDERPAVEALVARLDQIPLAIELAAARIRVLPPRALLDRIDERFELLQSARPGRHASLLRALSLTWELLSAGEQRFLAAASVFAGGFSLDAAAAVCAEGEGLGDALDLLDGLRAKALVQIEDAVPPRFFLFESVREFARMQLAHAGAENGILRRHAAWFSEQAAQHAERLDGPDPLGSIAWFEAERENLLAAHHRFSEEEPALSAACGVALSTYLCENTTAPDGTLLDSVVSAARRSGLRSTELRALRIRADAHMRRGNSDRARAGAEEALTLAASLGDRVEQGNSLVISAVIRLKTGDLAGALPEIEAALRFAQEANDKGLEGSALRILAIAQDMSGDSAESMRNFERAVRLFRELGNLRHEARALGYLGAAHARFGTFREARRAFRDARALLQRVGNVSAEADLLVNFGGLELADGNLEEAEAFTVRGLELERRLGSRTFEGVAVANLGLIRLERGDTRGALQALTEAVEIHDGWADDRHLGELLSFLAVAQATEGLAAEAEESLTQARAHFVKSGNAKALDEWALPKLYASLASARLGTRQADLQRLASEARALVDAVRSKKERISDFLSIGIRLLEGQLATIASGRAPLVVGPGAAWFEAPGQSRVDLRRRDAIKRILDALARQRAAAPGIGTSQQDLFETGWPGEKALPDSAALRVYNAIRTLRSLGLADALQRQADGYLLDPDLPLVHHE